MDFQISVDMIYVIAMVFGLKYRPHITYYYTFRWLSYSRDCNYRCRNTLIYRFDNIIIMVGSIGAGDGN